MIFVQPSPLKRRPGENLIKSLANGKWNSQLISAQPTIFPTKCFVDMAKCNDHYSECDISSEMTKGYFSYTFRVTCGTLKERWKVTEKIKNPAMSEAQIIRGPGNRRVP